MKIGIGVTTTPNRKNRVDECFNNLDKYSPIANLFIYNDENFKGVAYAKNMCIDKLKHNDYVFLFDDDCFPVDEDWVEYLVTAFENTGENHFLYLNESHQPYLKKHTGITIYKECGGVFMAMTKKAINEVGYMDSRYIGWGFEHAGYSNRIHLAGLNSAPYMMPDKLPNYLFAHDYEGEKIESSISDEAKQKNYQHNFTIFQEELRKHQPHKKFKP